jgi:hypothetical protein
MLELYLRHVGSKPLHGQCLLALEHDPRQPRETRLMLLRNKPLDALHIVIMRDQNALELHSGRGYQRVFSLLADYVPRPLHVVPVLLKAALHSFQHIVIQQKLHQAT